jgi:site-specific recombinase XerC
MLVAAGLACGRDHALISMPALNGLRVSEVVGAYVEGLGRGHRMLTIGSRGSLGRGIRMRSISSEPCSRSVRERLEVTPGSRSVPSTSDISW